MGEGRGARDVYWPVLVEVDYTQARPGEPGDPRSYPPLGREFYCDVP